MNTLPATLDWSAADAAHADLGDRYVTFCAALGQLHQEGATQQQIADRYDINQSAIAKAIAIGRDDRIIRSANTLPRSQETLYLMSKLPDAEFDSLASTETTRKVVLDVINKDRPPKPPAAPVDRYAGLRQSDVVFTRNGSHPQIKIAATGKTVVASCSPRNPETAARMLARDLIRTVSHHQGALT